MYVIMFPIGGTLYEKVYNINVGFNISCNFMGISSLFLCEFSIMAIS